MESATMRTCSILFVLALYASTPLQSQETPLAKKQSNYPPTMTGCEVDVYKTVGDTKLNIYIFKPPPHEGNESRPAIVFFFGGGWNGGTPQQFEQHCRYLALRGMIAMTVDYRVLSRNGTKANACVMDGKSAIRWVRMNAAKLGVDPDRIVAGGGSAGGHVAACTATIDGMEQHGEDLSVSSKPNGLALFNPATVIAPVAGIRELDAAKLASMHERVGVEPKGISPFHQLEKGLPPTTVFHGKADVTVPFATAEAFVEKAKANGDPAQLASYEGEGHGFFNYGRAKDEFYLKTVKQLDEFLVAYGLLEGPSPREVSVVE